MVSKYLNKVLLWLQEKADLDAEQGQNLVKVGELKVR